MSEHHEVAFNSNPFRTTMNQLSILVKYNPISTLTLGLLLLLVAFGGFFLLSFIAAAIGGTLGSIVALVGGIALMVIVIFRFSAAANYLHIASRHGKSLTSRQALDEAGKVNYNKFVLTSLATGILFILGFIALIIPGIFLIGRLSLAPFVAQIEGLGVQASLKRSWELTRGHWFEVFAAGIASAIVMGGLLSTVGGQSGLAGRYYELTHLKQTGANSGEVHWMNYLLTILAVLFILFYVALFRNAGNISKDNKSYDICDDSRYSGLCDTTNDSRDLNQTLPSQLDGSDFEYDYSSPAN